MTSASPAAAILLDLDGTVIDTHELIFACFQDTFREQVGVAVSRGMWERALGLPLETIFRVALAEAGLPDQSPEPFVRSYRARMAEMDGDIRPFPGIPEVLESLKRAGVLLGVVTTKHGTLAARHLRATRLDSLFGTVVTGDQCRNCKPHPEPFLRALEALGVEPHCAAGVGDSAYDVQASRAAGLWAGAACWGAMDLPALLAAGPDLTLQSPADLLSLLQSETYC